MSYVQVLRSWVVALGLGLITSGCESQVGTDQPKAAPPGSQAQERAAGRSADAGRGDSAASAREDLPDGLTELGAEDRAAAQRQRVCPVSGELLGSMGKPVKLTVKGQTVFLCCSGCEEEIRKDPDKYLARLKASQATK